MNMNRITQRSLTLIWTFIGLFGSVQGAESLLAKLPTIVGEDAVPLSIEMTRWKTAGLNIDVQDNGRVARLSCSASAGRQAAADYTIGSDHAPAERFRLWLKGDGTGNTLIVSCFHAPSKHWINLTELPLDFDDWRHLEIPAANPFHRFHPTITAVRFAVRCDETANSEVLIRTAELVTYRPVKPRRAKRSTPSPIFDTWGGPSEEQIEAGAKIGFNMHMAPIDFFEKPNVEQRVAYASKAVKWCRQRRIIPGISFYNHPSEAWMRKNASLLMMRFDGENYTAGGAHTSIWNPQARSLWRSHIIDCLKQNQANGSLQYVQLMELCPGEEGELSYNWDHIWAFEPHAIDAWHQYLRELYSDDIGRLNRDWASDHSDFDKIMPPSDRYPDREHWVFTDFYRLSLLRYSVFLADAVREVFIPKYWLWMTHSVPDYPQRMRAARYPLFYAENLQRLGCLDYAQIPALDWQSIEDVQYLQQIPVRVIGEIDVKPTIERLDWTFQQARKYGMDGVFIGVMETHSTNGQPTLIGERCSKLIRGFQASPP